MASPTEIYFQKHQEATAKWSGLRKRSAILSVFRFLSLVLALFGLYMYIDLTEVWWAYGSLFLMILFGFLVARHVDTKAAIKIQRAELDEIELEIKYLEGKLPSQRSNGDTYFNPDHAFSNDLDVFGDKSLYHHINRCFTPRGEDLLAMELQFPLSFEPIEEKQELTQSLSQHHDWNFRFRALGLQIDRGARLEEKITAWNESEVSKSFWRHPALLLVLALISSALLIYWLAIPNLRNFYNFFYAFIFNLLVTFSQFKPLKQQYNYLNKLAPSLMAFSQILSQVEQGHFQSKLGKKIQQEVKGQTPASRSLQKLSKIVNALDQVNNALVVLLLNGLFHYHLHTLNSLQRWRNGNALEMDKWLKAVAKLEVAVSKANYAFNHPYFNYPQAVSKAHFEAENMGHPLINKRQAVTNALHIKGWQYAILTGSNMSGKSTFLRTLGLNILLMELGLPVFADSMRSYPFKILTSMKLVDSVTRHESYFQAEVMRLRKLMDELDSEIIPFLLLDEILRGTNSEDKRKGTSLFMKRLVDYPAFGVLATHDIDIAELSKTQPQFFKALYFESTVKGGELQFDYKLRTGVCTTPNATDLLKNYGII